MNFKTKGHRELARPVRLKSNKRAGYRALKN